MTTTLRSTYKNLVMHRFRGMTGSIAVAAVLSLTACGDGGGGGGGSTPTAKAWGTAQLIETNNAGPAGVPQIAVDGNGNALAAWVQYDGTRTNIWANRFSAGSGWGTAQLIETDNKGSAYSPQIAFDGSGNAIAVWQQSDGTRANIWANRYTAATGAWGTAALIETDDTGGAYGPQIAFDGSGNAIAVWYQSDGTRDNILANRYSAATGAWGTAALIETDNAYASSPQIAFDDSGNAIAVWQQFDGARDSMWANRYTAATDAWGTAALIETDNAGSAFNPQLALDGSGNAIAVWRQSDGTRDNIWANRYTAATGAWGTAALIESDDAGGALFPQIAVDGSGNAIAVWVQDDGTRQNILANRYSAATDAWGTATLIETDNAGGAGNPQIAFDGSGNAIAVWYQSDGTRANIWANRYSGATNTWGTAALIETDDAGDAIAAPQIAFDGSGNAIAVWQQSDGTRDNIWANRYE